MDRKDAQGADHHCAENEKHQKAEYGPCDIRRAGIGWHNQKRAAQAHDQSPKQREWPSYRPLPLDRPMDFARGWFRSWQGDEPEKSPERRNPAPAMIRLNETNPFCGA